MGIIISFVYFYCKFYTLFMFYNKWNLHYNKIIKHKMFEFTFSSYLLNTSLDPLHCGCFLDTLTVVP